MFRYQIIASRNFCPNDRRVVHFMRNPAAPVLHDCKQKWAALALCVITGTAFGILFSALAGTNYFLLMRMALRSPVSIVGTAVAIVIPFLVSFYIVYYSKPWLVYLICGIRLFAFASIAFVINHIYGSGSWIVRFLLQFPDLCLIPVLLYASVRRLAGHADRRQSYSCIAFVMGVGIINYFVISPFLAQMIDSFETMGR